MCQCTILRCPTVRLCAATVLSWTSRDSAHSVQRSNSHLSHQRRRSRRRICLEQSSHCRRSIRPCHQGRKSSWSLCPFMQILEVIVFLLFSARTKCWRMTQPKFSTSIVLNNAKYCNSRAFRSRLVFGSAVNKCLRKKGLRPAYETLPNRSTSKSSNSARCDISRRCTISSRAASHHCPMSHLESGLWKRMRNFTYAISPSSWSSHKYGRNSSQGKPSGVFSVVSMTSAQRRWLMEPL
mmetsp:Transcript_86418/g.169069  ORF Transcript_86418/g.169069 Transcript_86418/m.169069 type:complete len:238 (-) Transcript_86418:559-1272(-)